MSDSTVVEDAGWLATELWKERAAPVRRLSHRQASQHCTGEAPGAKRGQVTNTRRKIAPKKNIIMVTAAVCLAGCLQQAIDCSARTSLPHPHTASKPLQVMPAAKDPCAL